MAIDLSVYEGLIFDMDGTLIDTMPAHMKAWKETAEHFNFIFDEQWIHSLGGMPSFKITSQVNMKYGLNLDPTIVSQFKMKAFSEIGNKGSIIECTYSLLMKHQSDKKLAVGTGSQRVSATQLLEQNNIIDKINALVTATDVENHKPNPDTFLRASELLDLEPSQCVVFEDTELGKQAAHAANMDCIMVVGGNQLELYPKPISS
ncbi:beta-phosphoglucomutase family hydrolase [Vibrio sp. 99-70-13A1]|uniref:beta-phosphoglucomutase family hydrolase n=1 Tax=Vibrio sp. 99-70-13A1 TaxID=2607601 RepID=UPI0014932FBF|nr:beta-phosphoglucomutase family hydrolase [Vibrio sp. 99-70-13A1]NOH99168.1 beta-phosphoglucomutase family hydrolase [Vibrio sp. 99-70-13A1]